MPVYIVTGKLGSGKTLVSVGKIRDKLAAGCMVATNLDLNLHKLIGSRAKNSRVMRIPDKPGIEDLHAIGNGNTSYNEDKNGLLVLDECGTWFNSRSWADKSRQEVINWFLHARKLGWDIIFLIQDHSIMDKQARLSLAEHVVYCRRMDRLTLPFIGGFYKAFVGSKFPLPKVHFAIVKYGDQQHSLTVDKWAYTGRDLYAAYDTKQAFSDDYPHGTYSLLPPWLTHGVFQVPRDGRFYMRLTRIYWRRFSRPVVAAAAFALGIFTTASVLMVDTVSDANAANATPPPPDLAALPGLHITGYTRLGEYVSYQLQDANGETYSTRDLEALGHRVVPRSSCSLILNPGEHHESIRC